MGVRVISWAVAALAAVLWHQGAVAAPQILAVLATDAPVPLLCDGATCRGEVSTYCLQRHRPVAGYGTAYAPPGPEGFTLVVTEADGAERRLPAAPYVTFAQHRSYTAVSVAVPESAVAGFAWTRLAIAVAPGATLVPLPRAGDPDPLSAAEIADATGPLRTLGSHLVDDSREAATARALGVLINALPADGGATDHAALRQRVMLEGAGGAAAEAHYEGCLGDVAEQRAYGLRSCLERRHDELMRDLNDAYWDAELGS